MAAVTGITTDQLSDWLAHRRETGQDTYDEWWNGEYRIVTGPSPEHGRLLVALTVLLYPLVDGAGLHVSAPVNIGTDKRDCRVPDLGVFEPGTTRTSAAFLATARLVVEVLSPSEEARAKLDFYRAHRIEEYLEIDLERHEVTLLRRRDDNWVQTEQSAALPLVIHGTRISDATDSQRSVDVTRF